MNNNKETNTETAIALGDVVRFKDDIEETGIVQKIRTREDWQGVEYLEYEVEIISETGPLTYKLVNADHRVRKA